MRVLVTGASGFIGGVLCRRLIERGEQVIGLVRRPGSAPPGTEEARGDLGPGGGLAETLADVRPDCVVHLAAEIASQRSEAKVREVNVDGTARLVEACRELAGEGAPRIVFSSTVVTGDARGELLSEERPLPVGTPYGRSKQEGERLILSSGLPAVVLRPCHVYGPGGWYAEELIPRLRGPGRLAVIGSGANLWDVVHVDDVVSAIVLAIDAPSPGGIYHVADDRPISFYDFMAMTAAELAVGAPRRVPVALARLIAGRNAVDAVVRSARTSNALIRRELGWSPRFPTAREGIPDAIRRLPGATVT